ncbi:MAG: hypothetical protein HC795_09575 [Coleofasciculaceae cyanobacterium RL_1_1]|nr:hypothetical protein [Coleofasciculaceae cyanobacterium RL_1_1]
MLRFKSNLFANSYISSVRSLADDPEITNKFSQYKTLVDILETSPVLRPSVPQYAQVSDILQRYLTAAFTESMTPERAMQAAARETRSLLDR